MTDDLDFRHDESKATTRYAKGNAMSRCVYMGSADVKKARPCTLVRCGLTSLHIVREDYVAYNFSNVNCLLFRT